MKHVNERVVNEPRAYLENGRWAIPPRGSYTSVWRSLCIVYCESLRWTFGTDWIDGY
jgi:hypothetical protein